jgi:hypothetical protein
VPSLLEIQLDVLLTRDEHGRLVATRDPVPRPAPRLVLGRSREGNLWATHRAVEPATRDELHRLCSSEPRLASPAAPRTRRCGERVLELLAPVEVELRGRSYVLPDRLPHDDRAREITAIESRDWPEAFPWLADEFALVGQRGRRAWPGAGARSTRAAQRRQPAEAHRS